MNFVDCDFDITYKQYVDSSNQDLSDTMYRKDLLTFFKCTTYNDTYEILKSEKKNSSLKAIIHCFTGSSEFAKNILDLDFYISVSGIITFKNSSELAKTVSSVPIEKLLVETDSPYLSPEPYRGKTNEPSFVVKVVEKLASIKKISPEEFFVLKY